MSNDKVKFVDDKRVYDEERIKLKEVLTELETLRQKSLQMHMEMQHELDTFDARDREDRERLIGLKEIVDQPLYTAEKFESLKATPYFMRLDIEADNNGIKKYYIGEKPIFGKNRFTQYTIVYDWREPMLYQGRYTRTKNYSAAGAKCDLYLRRSIEIYDSELKNINTEFDSDALILGGNVIDPFLLSVLRDKRRNNKLTNIIKTIQQNQSEIISQPLGDNFVVQGCAGSGKTMILLHRLSYLLYNNKNYSSFRTNSKIIAISKSILGEEFDYNAFENFKFDHSLINSSKSTSDSTNINEDIEI